MLVGLVEGLGGDFESVLLEFGAGCEGVEEVPHGRGTPMLIPI